MGGEKIINLSLQEGRFSFLKLKQLWFKRKQKKLKRQ